MKSPSGNVIRLGLELMSLTGTLGCNLTDNLELRFELRYNEADDDVASGNIFIDDSSSGFDDSEWIGLLEVLYEFN